MELSGTLGSQTPVPPARNHLRAKHSLLSSFLQQLFPGLLHNLWYTVTEPSASTLLPGDANDIPPSPHDSTTAVPYLTFPTIVGKNSAFHGLTQEQLEELGGIEFRALNMLMWAVPLVRPTAFPWFVVYLLSVLLFLVGHTLCCTGAIHVAPSLGGCFSGTQPTPEHISRLVSETNLLSGGFLTHIRFSLFQVAGAWANTGMSLVEYARARRYILQYLTVREAKIWSHSKRHILW